MSGAKGARGAMGAKGAWVLPRDYPAPALWLRARACGVLARSFLNVHAVDDADNGRIYRCRLAAERFACCASFEHYQNLFAHPGANSVDRQQRGSARLVVERHGLYEQQLRALELTVLLRRNERTDHARDLHASMGAGRLKPAPTMITSAPHRNDRRCRRCPRRPEPRPDKTESLLPCRGRKTPSR